MGDLGDVSAKQCRLVNRSNAESRGADISWRLAMGQGATIQAHATYSSIHLRDSAEPLRDRPRWRTGAMLSIPIGQKTSVYGEGLWVSSRFDFQLPVPQFNRAPSYLVADLAVRRRISDALSAYLRLD